MRPFDYWKSGQGLAHITPPSNEWPEGEGFRELVASTFFLQDTIEFGCGTGRLAKCFHPELYLGVDISSSAVARASVANPDHSFRTIGSRGVLDKGYCLFAHTVLLHIPDDDLLPTIGRFRQQRIIVSEILGREWRREGNPPVFNRGMMDYEAAFRSVGYKLHSVKFHPYPHYKNTDLELMEFHKI